MGVAGQGGASTSLCGTISSGVTLPDGAVLLAGVPADAFTLFLKADESYVYWASNDDIHRVSIADGTDSVFYTPPPGFNHIGGIDVAEGMLYFTESGPESRLGVAKMPTDGGAAPVSLAPDGANFPTVSAGFVYYATGHSGLARVPIAGGAAVTLATPVEFGEGRQFTVAGGYVWFINPQSGGDNDIQLQRVPIDTQASDAGASAVETLGSAGVHGSDVMSDSSNVYYGANSALLAIPLTGTTPAPIGPGATAGDILAVLPLAGSLLWSESGCTELHHSSPAGDALPALLRQANVSRLAANSKYVFASNLSQIIKIPRPK
jgi:hypothetical protein